MVAHCLNGLEPITRPQSLAVATRRHRRTSRATDRPNNDQLGLARKEHETMPIGSVPPPTQHPDEEPLICVPINREWIPVILGALQPMKYPEYWAGTLEENRGARRDFGILINQIMLAEGCDMASVCCEPTIYIYRINDDTGRFERSSDFGENWTTDPADPLYSFVKMPAQIRDTVDHTRCDAATNFSENFNSVITDSSENIGTAASVFELATAIAGIIIDIIVTIASGGTAGTVAVAVTSAIFSACVAAFTEGKTAFDAYWNSERKDAVFCAAYCTIGDNGQFSQTQWEDFKHKVRLELTPSPALDMVMTSVNAAGYVGGSNMASYGSAALADCASCDCECSDPCEIDWTFFGVEDVVKLSDCHYTMTKSAGGAHFAFTSGDQSLCCFFNMNIGFSFAWSSWGCGSAGINNVDPRSSTIWNFDTGNIDAGTELDIRFSTAPFE